MRKEVKRNWDWADKYMDQVEMILRMNAMYLLDIRIANKQKDTEESTDLVITVNGGDVAVRLRRPHYDYRDLTIRARAGAKTEIDKIKAGFAKWYLYGWVSDDTIQEWMLVDLDIVRNKGLLNDRDIIPNTDGRTGFIAIPHTELEENGCLIASQIGRN